MVKKTISGNNEVLIGQELLRQGHIKNKQLADALALQESQGGTLAEVLCSLIPGDPSPICQAIAEIIGIPGRWVRPDRIEILPEILSKVSPSLATHYGVIPVNMENGVLHLATARPQDIEALDEIELITKCRIMPYLALSEHIQDGIKKHYGVGADTLALMHSNTDKTLVIEDSDQHVIDDDSGDVSIIRFVNQIISEAHKLNATDIHFEPERQSFRIRYRIDGLLEEITVPPQIKEYQSAVTSRIKVMAHLDIAEQRLPQDGRILIKIGNESFDLRVSVLPTPLGEAIDLRLLRRTNVHLSLEELGYASHNLYELERAATQPNGIILITGPTGSGKTTSLYALLERVNTVEKKIITIEDPIEYHMTGMIQMQVHEEIGFTFASALRSILRHDPDIVLVGEIRDSETANIAIRMAMTGHLVFSTLHTNDAASSIARLIDMGEEPYLLATTINCVVAQRLIRLLCPVCKTAFTPDPVTLQPFVESKFEMPEIFYQPKGCENCRRSGYRGRNGIHEILSIDEDFRKLIMQRSPAAEFRRCAVNKGIHLMRHDCWDRLLRGVTSLEEVIRVTRDIEI
jgi:type II secretory ATPase GspE/PulE/Tfp pilus assembly ATPase PilB-like protein